MNIFKELAKYDFHDSLLERIIYEKDSGKILLEIDFCNWKQNWYNDSSEETSMITLIFDDVSDVIIPEFKLNSDEIIEFESLPGKGIKFVVFNDTNDCSYEIIFNAKTVKII